MQGTEEPQVEPQAPTEESQPIQAPEAQFDPSALSNEAFEQIMEARWDSIRSHPKVNAEIQSLTKKRVDRETKELRERDQQAQVARQFMATWEATPIEQRLKFLENPETRTRYDQMRTLANVPTGASREDISKQAWESVGKMLKETEGFEDLPFEDITSEHEDDLPGAIVAVAKHRVEKDRKTMLKDLEQWKEATKNEIRAEILGGKPEPDASENEGDPGSEAWKELPADEKIALALAEQRKKK